MLLCESGARSRHGTHFINQTAALLYWCLSHQQVTEDDFIEHHANLSFGTKSDADFRELVINCWGLDDGRGDGDNHLPADVARVVSRANAPHRKFLVTCADGSQRVEGLPFSTEVSSATNLVLGMLFMHTTVVPRKK